MSDWFVAVNGKSEGPFSESHVRDRLISGSLAPDTMVWCDGMQEWTAASQVPAFSGQQAGATGAAPAPPVISASHAHEIDFEIFGHEMQFVEIELDPGESVVSEAGAMMYMTDGIEMQTVFGDGSEQSQSGGVFDKLIGAGKRLITGESLFCTIFTHTTAGKGKVAFASPFPGKIIPLDLRKYDNSLICQKDAFLCAAKGVSIGVAFQKKIGAGLFGGEGFIMQKLEGDGLAFVHAGGTIVERELAPGQSLRVDTGCLVALTHTVAYDVVSVGGVKSAIFSGEGFFFAQLTGPGHVWLQSLPFSRLAGRIHSAAPQNNAGFSSQGEGSVLGELGRIFKN